MQHPPLDVDAACDLVRDQLSRHFAPIERDVRADAMRHLGVPLHSLTVDLQFGTKPLAVVRDDDGHTFVLKRAEPALLAAEECAWALRSLGRRPAVPAVVATIVLDDHEVTGLLKPYVDLTGGQLGPDTTQWTPLQRAVLLIEQAWEHLLENLDANFSQYALVGPERVPVNMDWDRSFAAASAPLSRFLKYRTGLPNARTFLYADYVEGRVDLPLALLVREARRVRDLPTDAVRAILERYARVRFGDDAAATTAFVERIIHRKRAIEVAVARFIRDLRAERARLLPPLSPGNRVERAGKHLWDQWQVFLHVIGRGPIGTLVRRLLRLVRRRPALNR